MKRLVLLVLVLAMLAGCAQTPVETTQPGEISEETATVPAQASFGLSCRMEAGLNPYTCTALINRPVMALLYQGLFTVTAQYQAEPVLCQQYSSAPDGKTYTFILAEATFSDGSALTAQDVVASLQAAMDSPVYGGRLSHVTGLTAQDSRTVRITLDTAYGNLPVLLDIPIVRAADVAANEPLGTGPYALSGSSLTRRQNWWSDYTPAVTVSSIVLSQADTSGALRDQFEFGKTDLVCADPGAADYVAYRCDYELWDCPTGILLYLGCNASGSSPFANGTVRAALTHGVNRRALAEIYHGFAQEAYLPASPEAACYDSALAAQYGYDAAAFTAALSQAGLRNTQATLLADGSNPLRVTVAQTIAQQLTDCGLTVTVNAPESQEDYLQALAVGNFDFYLAEVRLSPTFDLSVFFQEDGALGYGGMADGELYQLCLKALENSGNYYDLFSAVMEDGQLCPLLFRTYAVYTTRGSVSGLLPGLDNVFHTANSRQLADAWTDWTGSTEPPTETTEPTEP